MCVHLTACYLWQKLLRLMQVLPEEFLRWLSGLASTLCFHGTRRFSLGLFIRHFVLAAVFSMELICGLSKNHFDRVYFLCTVLLPFSGSDRLRQRRELPRLCLHLSAIAAERGRSNLHIYLRLPGWEVIMSHCQIPYQVLFVQWGFFRTILLFTEIPHNAR